MEFVQHETLWLRLSRITLHYIQATVFIGSVALQYNRPHKNNAIYLRFMIQTRSK